MADNDITLSGQAGSTKQGSGSAAKKGMPIIGIVKDNIDPTRSGMIQVQLEGSTDPGSASKNSGSWVKVRYLSTYFGSVKPTSGDSGAGTYKGNPSSYGQWQSPPDIGTKVVCIFINGDPTRGFYIGAVPEPEMLQMVPAIGASDKVVANEGEAQGYGGATRLPVTNINTNDKKTADSPDFNDQPRPVHSYAASIMSQQGIIRDPIRGPISSSASREPSSRVGWGVSTPGRPIYNGGYDDSNLPNNLDQKKAEQLAVVARRGGHSIVMDDGDIIGRDQLIRIRTALGHQILMSDDGQTLMILHSNGQSYVELGKEGTVDIYSSNSFNVRTQGDINLHADQHINIHAMENLNIQAKNIHVNSEEITKFRAGKDFQVNSLSNYMVKAGSAVAMAAGGEASLVAGSSAYVNGSKVNLNSGNPGTSPIDVPIITLLAQTDTLFDQEKGWAAAPGKLLSIASRVPAHAPWANAGQGISIKTSAGASDSLPPAPSTAVQKTNQASQSAGTAPPAVATVASVPPSSSVSSSVDKGTTAAVLAATATAASSGATATATQQGASIIGSSTSAAGSTTATVAAGSFGQTVDQLTSSGVLKPGSSTLINGLVSSGTSLTNAVPAALFTGVPGAENIESLVTNVGAQTSSMVETMQKAQTALVTAGVITGKETAVQTAGLVTAAATSGVNTTINAIREVSSSISSVAPAASNIATTVSAGTAQSTINQFQNALSGVASFSSTANGVLSAIGAGSAAAGLSSALSGLGGIANSVNSLLGSANKLSLSSIVGSVQGVAADAFNAIKNSFPKLKANVPQYLTQTAKDRAASSAIIGSQPAGQTNTTAPLSTAANNTPATPAPNTTSVVNGGTNTIENTVAGIAGTTNTITTTLNNINNVATSIKGASTNTIGIVTAGTNIEPMIDSTISTLTNISATSSQTEALINSLTTPSTISTVNNAVNQVSGLAGATQAIMSGGLPELSSAAKAVQSGASAARASALASGLSNLPGGSGAAATIVDNASAAIHVPGASSLTGTISNIQTSVQSGLGSIVQISSSIAGISNDVNNVVGTVSTVSNTINNTVNTASSVNSLLNNVSSATQTLSNLSSNIAPAVTNIAGTAEQVTGMLGDAANKLNGLTNAITSNLNSSDASSLLASLSSLGAGGPSPVKIPEIGFNTFARGELTTQVTSLLNDPGIPQPNLIGDINPETENTLNQAITENYKKIEGIQAKINELDPQLTAARNEYFQAENSLPAGDPGIDAAKEKYNTLLNQMNTLVSKMDEFLYDDQSSGLGANATPAGEGSIILT